MADLHLTYDSALLAVKFGCFEANKEICKVDIFNFILLI